MRVILGSCLALALASAAPALAAPQGYDAPQGDQQDQSSYRDQSGNQDQAPRAHRGRTFAVGDRVPQRMLQGKHVFTRYGRRGIDAPPQGEEWLRTPRAFLLVSANDGRVMQVVERAPRAGGHRGRRAQQYQGDQGPQGYPDDQGSQDQQGYPGDQGQQDDQGYPDDGQSQ